MYQLRTTLTPVQIKQFCNINSIGITELILKSPTTKNRKILSQKIIINKTDVTVNTTNAPSEEFNTEQPNTSDEGNNYKIRTKDHLGVTALVATMEPATESKSSRANKEPQQSHPSNK